jgi:hypothetical protein
MPASDSMAISAYKLDQDVIGVLEGSEGCGVAGHDWPLAFAIEARAFSCHATVCEPLKP